MVIDDFAVAEAWACAACIARAGLPASDGRAYAARGRCQVGGHDVAERVEWVEGVCVEPVSAILPAPSNEPQQLSMF